MHAAAISRAEAVRRDPGAGPGGQRRGDRAAGRLVSPGADGGWSTPRPTWSSTARGPGTARTTRPSRSWPTGGPSATAEPAVLAVPRGLVARLSLLYRPDARGPRRPTSTGRIARAAARASRRRSSRTSSAPRSTCATAAGDPGPAGRVGGARPGPRRRPRARQPVRADAPRGVGRWGSIPRLVRANRQADAPLAEPRPADVSLDTDGSPPCSRPAPADDRGGDGGLRPAGAETSRCIPLALGVGGLSPSRPPRRISVSRFRKQPPRERATCGLGREDRS